MACLGYPVRARSRDPQPPRSLILAGSAICVQQPGREPPAESCRPCKIVESTTSNNAREEVHYDLPVRA